MTLMDKACYERGCICYDSQDQNEFVEVVLAKQGEPVKLLAYNCTCGKTMKFESEHGIVAQQRTWVGLTDREKSNLWLESRAAIPRFYTYAALVEAKLRSKNEKL